MNTNNKVRAPCELCHRVTNHSVVNEHHEAEEEDYHCDVAYYIITCDGCDKPSFRYQFTDYESSFPISDTEWEVAKTIITYPRVIENHVPLDGLHFVPELVRDVYEESLHAMQNETSVLAGLGLRATIEAICNEQGITGRTLDVRITKLATQGLISRGDSSRLHTIRFLGNDAAHEIKKASKGQLAIALRIVEHLIASVYILDKQAKGQLDTVVSDYKEFEEILYGHISKYNQGDEYPLAKYLGKDVRRMTGALSSLESQLIQTISAGTINWLALGKIAKYANSQSSLQHFIKV